MNSIGSDIALLNLKWTFFFLLHNTAVLRTSYIINFNETSYTYKFLARVISYFFMGFFFLFFLRFVFFVSKVGNGFF